MELKRSIVSSDSFAPVPVGARMTFVIAVLASGFLSGALVGSPWQLLAMAPILVAGTQVLNRLRQRVAEAHGTSDQSVPLVPRGVDVALMLLAAAAAFGLAFLFPDALCQSGPLFALWVSMYQLLQDPFERRYWRRSQIAVGKGMVWPLLG